jgi:hypothetical protein
LTARKQSLDIDRSQIQTAIDELTELQSSAPGEAVQRAAGYFRYAPLWAAGIAKRLRRWAELAPSFGESTTDTPLHYLAELQRLVGMVLQRRGDACSVDTRSIQLAILDINALMGCGDLWKHADCGELLPLILERLIANKTDAEKARLRAVVSEADSAIQRLIEPPTVRDPVAIVTQSSPLTNHILTPFQIEILKALDGKALKLQALADRLSGADTKRLYNEGLKTVLMEKGLIEHVNAGYYRPDAPPPGWVFTPKPQ